MGGQERRGTVAPLPSPGLISTAFPEIYLERGSWAAFRAFQEAGGAMRLAGEYAEEEEQQRQQEEEEEDEEELARGTHDREHDEAMIDYSHPDTPIPINSDATPSSSGAVDHGAEAWEIIAAHDRENDVMVDVVFVDDNNSDISNENDDEEEEEGGESWDPWTASDFGTTADTDHDHDHDHEEDDEAEDEDWTDDIHPETQLEFGLHFHGLMNVVFRSDNPDADAGVEIEMEMDTDSDSD
jgi:hypothetical protein